MKELHEERMRLFTNFSHELCHFRGQYRQSDFNFTILRGKFKGIG